MSGRSYQSHQNTNSAAIRQEIQRFESVHPSIYAIYDVIEAIPDQLIKQHLKEHVVCIEDSFVNSQEWTLCRSVPDLKLGILGTTDSGKSALVHRYLTGSYMQEESPEGGRFKKEVVLEGQSYLLLIRDEGGEPELQFTHWVDAVIFVFSLENEVSFSKIYRYYTLLSRSRPLSDVPIVLVGTQDAISESNPRVIDDSRARRLSQDLKCVSYYETCATYGLNVERVFQDVCYRISQQRYPHLLSSVARPNTPSQPLRQLYSQQQHAAGMSPTTAPALTSSKSYEAQRGGAPIIGRGSPDTSLGSAGTPPTSTQNLQGPSPKDSKSKSRFLFRDKSERSSQSEHHQSQTRVSDPPIGSFSHVQPHQAVAIPVAIPTVPLSSTASRPSLNDDMVTMSSFAPTHSVHYTNSQHHHSEKRDMPPPNQTPVLPRKSPANRVDQQSGRKAQAVQKSNSFSDRMDDVFKDLHVSKEGPLTPLLSRIPRIRSSLVLKKDDDKKQQNVNGQLGSGRTIPIKQGWLYKKSNKPLSKEWKKKYVTLLDDGRLTYHSNLHEYMEDSHGKDIDLTHTTVKVPGLKPKGSRSTPLAPEMMNGKSGKESVIISAFEQDAIVIPNNTANSGHPLAFDNSVYIGHPGPVEAANARETPNVNKKRHRRAKSSAKNAEGGDDSEGFEFQIVSLQNRIWQFEAPSLEERDDWVAKIENQILSSLQSLQSDKSKNRGTGQTPVNTSQMIRAVKGNNLCADCDSPNPDWASLNLGALICIECSGIHRNLGTHLSRVRSLELDEWPADLVAVMTSLGNHIVNSIWEARLGENSKPRPGTSREEKELFIRGKYEQKSFLPPLPYQDIRLSQQLIDKIARQDVPSTVLVLAYCTPDDVNGPYSDEDTKTALHIAAALGNVVLVQMLLWYGANMKKLDHEHHNALWYATKSNNQACITLLRNQGCPENPTLPRRRASATQQQSNEAVDKVPSSVI